MVKLAGKYANVISRNPIASAVAGGLGAAGLATLGNVLSGEAQTEQGGRLGLEAVGAGALGAVLGAQIPALRGKASQLYRNIGNVSLENPGAVARKAQMSPREIQQAEFMRDILNETVKTGVVSPQQMRDDIKTSLKRSQAGINAGVIPAGVLAAGALGGMTGGGIANLAAGMGLPGMGIDPEGYGSNNTPSAQFGVKSLASTQYV